MLTISGGADPQVFLHPRKLALPPVGKFLDNHSGSTLDSSLRLCCRDPQERAIPSHHSKPLILSSKVLPHKRQSLPRGCFGYLRKTKKRQKAQGQAELGKTSTLLAPNGATEDFPLGFPFFYNHRSWHKTRNLSHTLSQNLQNNVLWELVFSFYR